MSSNSTLISSVPTIKDITKRNIPNIKRVRRFLSHVILRPLNPPPNTRPTYKKIQKTNNPKKIPNKVEYSTIIKDDSAFVEVDLSTLRPPLPCITKESVDDLSYLRRHANLKQSERKQNWNDSFTCLIPKKKVSHPDLSFRPPLAGVSEIMVCTDTLVPTFLGCFVKKNCKSTVDEIFSELYGGSFSF